MKLSVTTAVAIRRQLDSRPLCYAAFAVILPIVCWRMSPVAGLLAGLVPALVIALAARAWKHALAWLVLSALASGVLLHRETRLLHGERRIASHSGGLHEFDVRLLADADGDAKHWSAPARILAGPCRGERVWLTARGPMAAAHSTIRCRGMLATLPGIRNPGAFDRSAWLRRDGITGMLRTIRISGCHTTRIARTAHAIRSGFRERITAGLDPDTDEANTIRAIVLGEKPESDDPLLLSFRNSGTLHLFAVSGMHVGMVGLLAWSVLRLFRVPRRTSIPLLLPVLFGYAWLTGNAPPAVRAAAMAAIFLGATFFRRRPDLTNTIGATLLIFLLWNPSLIFSPGVQLSFGAIFAIAVGGRLWQRILPDTRISEDCYLPPDLRGWLQRCGSGFRRWFLGALRVSVSAAAGTAPLTAWHFGLVVPISILANLVLGSVVFALLAVALTSVALSGIWPTGGRGLNQMNARIAQTIHASADAFARVPGGHFAVGRPHGKPAIICYDLDRGASCTCVAGGDGSAMLINCGSTHSLGKVIAPSLRSLFIEPDSILLTQPDAAHIGGELSAWDILPIRQAMLPVRKSRSAFYRKWLSDAPAAGVALRFAQDGLMLPTSDGGTIEVLHEPDQESQSLRADERVCVVRLTWHGWRVLFTSNAGARIERALLASGKDLRADLIVAGRHGSDLSLTDPFVHAVAPRCIVLCRPRRGSPAHGPRRIERWVEQGIRIVEQRQVGGVVMTPEPDGGLSILGYCDGSMIHLRP